MRAKSVILSILCAGAVGGVAIWVGIGYQARLGLEEENQGLRQQLDEMGELAAENERLSNLVAQASSSHSLAEDQMRELLRLRAEVRLFVSGARHPNPRPMSPAKLPPAQSLVPLPRRNGLRNRGPLWDASPSAAGGESLPVGREPR